MTHKLKITPGYNISKTINEARLMFIFEEKYVNCKSNQSDGYEKDCFIYAENWAALMQIELVNGKKLTDIYKITSFEADTEGITGYMYDMAVNILSQFWKHGEELRKLHNKEYGKEGDGVVNPALLIIKN